MTETTRSETGEQAPDQTVEEMMAQSDHFEIDGTTIAEQTHESDDSDGSDEPNTDGTGAIVDQTGGVPGYADVDEFDMDRRDRKILDLLKENGRMAFNAIADELDVSSPTASDRISRLEEAGVIESFTIEVNPRAVDTAELSTRALERLLAHAKTSRADPSTPWHEADEEAYREARAVLGSDGGE